MPTLSTFIREHTEEILAKWEVFARGLPIGDAMDIAALRDHAKAMLAVIVTDLCGSQTMRDQASKSRGERDADGAGTQTAAQEHGTDRAGSGFSVEELVAEFRALRASVILLWTERQVTVGPDELEELIRFNEAIDQAIAESIERYTHAIARSRDRFLAILGHDLRTPIGSIMTASTFMVEAGGLTEPYLTLVSRNGRTARRMNQMVADLLDFTRASLGDGIPVVRADMDVGSMVRGVVAEVAILYPDPVLQLTLNGELTGAWDEARLAQALTNLVVNAIQHGDATAPIQVGARGSARDVTITVQNAGPVIAREEWARLFQPTQRGANDNAGADHLGLGLFIVDKIAGAHGGSLTVDSTERDGTTFTMRLPRSAVD
jgi:signal transduction histidine kinase